ncbi:MAG: hypothetical protein U0350_39905 [Caldilineaceae bacterium]
MSEDFSQPMLTLEHLRRLELQAGDMLVVQCQDSLSEATYQHLKHTLEKLIPHHKIIILLNGMTMGVIHQTEGDSNAA